MFIESISIVSRTSPNWSIEVERSILLKIMFIKKRFTFDNRVYKTFDEPSDGVCWGEEDVDHELAEACHHAHHYQGQALSEVG